MRRIFVQVCLLSLFHPFGTCAQASASTGGGIMEKLIEYREAETVLEGFVAWPKSLKGQAPIVLLVHEWMGLGDYAKRRARMIAELGYVAFAADIYGKGVRAKSMDEAGKLATLYKTNRPLMRKRIQAAFDQAVKLPMAMSQKVAVMGYCFGGTVALELARGGAPILGAVSFHGGLATPTPEDAKNIKGRVLVLHGADDPVVPAEEVSAFQAEMRKGGVDWQLVSYGGAKHSFTNPDAGNNRDSPMAYSPTADQRSWVAMQSFFKEIFKK